MTSTELFAIAFSALMLVVAVVNCLWKFRLQRKVGGLEEILRKTASENDRLQGENERLTKNGVGETTVLALAGEIARMENNLFRMSEVPGRKQVLRALERMKTALEAEGYTMTPLLGRPYQEGMMATVVFVPDETLPVGTSRIISVQKPLVLRGGKMIQAATVTVGQNM